MFVSIRLCTYFWKKRVQEIFIRDIQCRMPITTVLGTLFEHSTSTSLTTMPKIEKSIKKKMKNLKQYNPKNDIQTLQYEGELEAPKTPQKNP